eukprot:SAG31_NODE_1064_length_10098_cov_3.617462_3_plen_208_part_00
MDFNSGEPNLDRVSGEQASRVPDMYGYRVITGKNNRDRWQSAVSEAKDFLNKLDEHVVDMKAHVTTSNRVVIIILYQKDRPSSGGHWIRGAPRRENWETTVRRVQVEINTPGNSPRQIQSNFISASLSPIVRHLQLRGQAMLEIARFNILHLTDFTVFIATPAGKKRRLQQEHPGMHRSVWSLIHWEHLDQVYPQRDMGSGFARAAD